MQTVMREPSKSSRDVTAPTPPPRSEKPGPAPKRPQPVSAPTLATPQIAMPLLGNERAPEPEPEKERAVDFLFDPDTKKKRQRPPPTLDDDGVFDKKKRRRWVFPLLVVSAILAPSVVPRITVEIEFANAAIGSQCSSVDLIDNVFEAEIAPTRTFGFADELEQLREQGLALGGSVRNAVLLDNDRVVNEEGLRFADEFARHKILDCLGDLALAEAPIFGQLYAHKPGHRLNNALLREMFAHADAWSRLTYEEINYRIGEEQMTENSYLNRVIELLAPCKSGL